MERSVSAYTNDIRTRSALKHLGFRNASKIASSLQGNVWRAVNQIQHAETSIIKVTNKVLYAASMAVVGGQTCKVMENVLTEQAIMKYLTKKKDCTPHIVKIKQFYHTSVYSSICTSYFHNMYIEIIHSKSAYYLEMEDGGSTLFDFVQKGHEYINDGSIDISEWQKVANIILKQMIDCIEYIHSKNVCHFDISLENWCINDVKLEVDKYTNGMEKIRFVTDSIQIKLCDFGLAKLFTSKTCLSNKYCGKEHYKSPEITHKKTYFDAKANDIWSLGICAFVLFTGSFPFQVAHRSDNDFLFVMNYGVNELLKCWERTHYVPDNLIHLFDAIFRLEDDRVSLTAIKKLCHRHIM